MTGDCHVRICEGLGVKFPRSTRLCQVECLKVNISAMKDTSQKAEIINTTKETVEKVQICIFMNFKDSQIS